MLVCTVILKRAPESLSSVNVKGVIRISRNKMYAKTQKIIVILDYSVSKKFPFLRGLLPIVTRKAAVPSIICVIISQHHIASVHLAARVGKCRKKRKSLIR